MIVRDASGSTLYSEWSSVEACASAEEAEALACLQGLRYLIENPQQPGILESDCARLVSLLSSSETDRSAHWSLLAEARELLNILPEVKMSKVDRVSNAVAHDLAQLGKRECGVMHGSIPSCAMESLMHDCNELVA